MHHHHQYDHHHRPRPHHQDSHLHYHTAQDRWGARTPRWAGGERAAGCWRKTCLKCFLGLSARCVLDFISIFYLCKYKLRYSMTLINWAVYRICNIDVALDQRGVFIYKMRSTPQESSWFFEVPLDLPVKIFTKSLIWHNLLNNEETSAWNEKLSWLLTSSIIISVFNVANSFDGQTVIITAWNSILSRIAITVYHCCHLVLFENLQEQDVRK